MSSALPSGEHNFLADASRSCAREAGEFDRIVGRRVALCEHFAPPFTLTACASLRSLVSAGMTCQRPGFGCARQAFLAAACSSSPLRTDALTR